MELLVSKRELNSKLNQNESKKTKEKNHHLNHLHPKSSVNNSHHHLIKFLNYAIIYLCLVMFFSNKVNGRAIFS